MTTPFDPRPFIRASQALRAFADPDAAAIQSLRSRPNDMKRILEEVRSASKRLENLERLLDNVMIPPYVFDLTSPTTVGEVIVYKLEQQPEVKLTELQPFYGSGVYILYYHGELPVYEAISGTDCPIYVGKAGPDVPNADTPRKQGIALYRRINEHYTKSIAKAANLSPADFLCRYLAVQSGLEKAAEEFLIRRYSPVWNDESAVCSGIGKHGDKARREKSDWDTLHPGRPWADTQTSRSGATAATVAANIDRHHRGLLASDRAKWAKLFNPAWVEKQTP